MRYCTPGGHRSRRTWRREKSGFLPIKMGILRVFSVITPVAARLNSSPMIWSFLPGPINMCLVKNHEGRFQISIPEHAPSTTLTLAVPSFGL